MKAPINDGKALKEAVASGGERLALFYASSCPFCDAFLPAYERRVPGPMALRVLVDDWGGLVEEYSIEVVPTVVFFKGGRVAARLDGVLGKGLSEEMLDDFMRRCGLGKTHARG